MFTGLQASSLILDRFHYLAWDQFGIHLIKSCYIAFACVLLIRYLSFRSQRNFENLVESYNRVVAKTVLEAGEIRRESRVNPILNMVLAVLACIDFALVFQWSEPVLKISIWLDFLIWALILRWLGRTFWLKTKGTRERLKEVLDDARSRLRDETSGPPVVEKRISKTPFACLSLISLVVALAISLLRWHEVREVFRVDDLKTCMEKGMRQASQRFYQQGELRIDSAEEPCVRESHGKVVYSLDFHGGDLHLHAVESDSVDYFGNGKKGDEGLTLDAKGRFRSTGKPKSQNIEE